MAQYDNNPLPRGPFPYDGPTETTTPALLSDLAERLWAKGSDEGIKLAREAETIGNLWRHFRPDRMAEVEAEVAKLIEKMRAELKAAQ